MVQMQMCGGRHAAIAALRALDRLDAQRAGPERDIAVALGERGREVIAPSRETVVSAI